MPDPRPITVVGEFFFISFFVSTFAIREYLLSLANLLRMSEQIKLVIEIIPLQKLSSEGNNDSLLRRERGRADSVRTC